MPVTIQPQNHLNDKIIASLTRIVGDLEACSPTRQSFERWTDAPGSSQLWTGMFNERMVGFALIEKNQLSLLAVHGATRHRGVGTQMITLLLKKKPHLAVDPQVKDIQFIAFFESLKAMNP